jgi:tRNA-splicing ligase RtcB
MSRRRRSASPATNKSWPVMHCGSRGFGHQVASDYLKVFEKSMPRYGITVKDQQLACAPFRSSEG